MSEFKGTPGPWRVSKTGRGIGPISGADDQSFGMMVEVAFVEVDPEIEVQEANAHLIAAAPELLEALLDIINMEYEPNESDTTYLKARKAISKALSETK